MPVRPAAALVAVAAACAFVAPAEAATISVNSLADAADPAPADLVCDAGGGACTLRAAIQTANADPARGDTIFVPVGKIKLGIAGAEKQADPAATGDLDILGRVTILGRGAGTTVVDAAGLDRIFDVHTGAVALITALTVTGGSPSFADPVGTVVGGALRAAGQLTFDHASAESSHAPTGGGAATDGDGVLLLRTATVQGNKATGPGATGGGVAEVGGRVEVTDTLVRGNSAPAGGGVLEAGGGSIDISGSTIAANSAAGNGGGILMTGGGTVTVTNTTLTQNTAGSAGPGALATGGQLTFLNATLAGDGGTEIDAVTASARNTIVSGGGCARPVASNGQNLESGDTCGFHAGGDLPGTDPLLGPLSDNFGPTPTMALPAGSPAIDRAAGCPPVDQRGVPRPQPPGGQCDIGAYEAGGPTRGGVGGFGGTLTGAGSPTPGADELGGAASSAARPSRTCVSRRRFPIRIRIRRGVRVRSVSARLTTSKRTFKVTGRGRLRRATVDLRGLKRSRYTVAITIARNKGKPLKQSRRYRTCTRKGAASRRAVTE